MARWLLLVLGALACSFPALADPTRLTLQLSNIRQVQFAGYYVAAAKGYYAAAGLDITILAGRVNGDTEAIAASPGVDIWSAWMPQALAAREHGEPLVNIAQIFPHSGLVLVCRKASNIHSPEDLKGKTVGVWQDGAQIPFLAWMRKLKLLVPGDVTMLPIPRAHGDAATDPLMNRDVACVNALNYDQYWQLIAAGLQPGELQVFHYGDFGVSLLQDGLYAREAVLADPARSDVLVRFLRASVEGWKYAVTHQDEAVRIVMDDGRPENVADVLTQTRMMSSVARLTESGLQRMGYLEPAAFDRVVQILLQAGPGAPINQPPVGAWTHDIWERAANPGTPIK